MKMFALLKNRYIKLSNRCDFFFTYPILFQKLILKSFSNPKDDFERSFFQYKCQMELIGAWKHLLFSVASFFLFWFFYFSSRLHKAEETEAHKAVYFDNADFAVLPPSLLQKYTDVIQQKGGFNLSLDREDSRFVRSIIRRYPFSWYFTFKCMLKVALYSNLIKSTNPKAIIVSDEYSFTSSVQTAYCEQKGIELIDVMHGEKMFSMRDSFFRFHRCYIWDEYYRKLFIELRAEPQQFVVEVPPAQMTWNEENIEKSIDFTYYLQDQRGKTLKTISQSLKMLKSRGYTVAVRPHPLFSEKSEVNSLFDGLFIEDNNEISVTKSVLRTNNVISLYSTVLKQGLNNNIPIVIDDVSDTKKFEKLSELGYICLKEEHRLLSDLLLQDNF